jgi:pseudouridylate synthase
MQPTPPLEIHADVAAALKSARPVVALASAPFTHSLPWPANLHTFQQSQSAARAEGAVLALIAVRQGRLTVGMDSGEVEALFRDGSAIRASRRDLAMAVVGGGNAATTVSASMYIAGKAGIRLLVTGAIGGATRPPSYDDDHAWDISADLVELSHTPVAVVSAGARSVHNLAYTSEVLETFRVPVIGYGTDVFPTFYMRAGSHPVPVRADTPAKIAALLSAHWNMDGAGVVVMQPTPADVALSPDELLPALHLVESQMVSDHVSRDLSPGLMERLDRLTKGKALRAYQSILVANTRLAAHIARELAK